MSFLLGIFLGIRLPVIGAMNGVRGIGEESGGYEVHCANYPTINYAKLTVMENVNAMTNVQSLVKIVLLCKGRYLQGWGGGAEGD